MRPPITPGVEAFVDQNPVDPAEKPAVTIEGLEFLVSLDECVLRGVGGFVVVSQQPERDGEEQPLVALDEA